MFECVQVPVHLVVDFKVLLVRLNLGSSLRENCYLLHPTLRLGHHQQYNQHQSLCQLGSVKKAGGPSLTRGEPRMKGRNIENKKKFLRKYGGIKPRTRSDLLDGGSKYEIESHPQRKTERVLSREGLASRSLQLDLSSREEIYYPMRRTSNASERSTRTAR